jgi:hypothetical protein
MGAGLGADEREQLIGLLGILQDHLRSLNGHGNQNRGPA